jgi:hypothetical protein
VDSYYRNSLYEKEQCFFCCCFRAAAAAGAAAADFAAATDSVAPTIAAAATASALAPGSVDAGIYVAAVITGSLLRVRSELAYVVRLPVLARACGLVRLMLRLLLLLPSLFASASISK